MKNIGHRLFSLGLIAATLCCLDTADAQTNAVVATPQQLTFNTQTGVTTPSQSILLSSASGTANISVTAHSDTNWLIVTPRARTTPLVVTVSIGAGAPTSGARRRLYQHPFGDHKSVRARYAQCEFNGRDQSDFFESQLAQLRFRATAAQRRNRRVFTLSSSSSSVTNFTATPITNSGTPWLSVSPTAGSLPGILQVTVNPVSLLSSPGTFSAAVAINAPGTNGISIPVLVTIQGVPSLDVSPAQLSFGYQLGTAAPPAETLTLSSSTGANVSFTATAQTTTCGNWIVLNQNSGATPSTLSVSK